LKFSKLKNKEFLMAKKIDFLIAKVKPFQGTLENMDSKTKGGHVPIQLAENFNKLVAEIATHEPDAARELPCPITLEGQMALIGATDISYSSLEIMVGQVLGVLEVLKASQ
jgi:hypothetical protein